jgi:hypothetical protein
VFVGAAWLAMLAVGHRYVTTLASPVPFWDDLQMSPQLADGHAITLDWLWTPWNQHRIPLPKIVFLGLVGSFRDLRAGMLFEVYVLAAVALAMVLGARKIRGHTSYADAFFPFLWLHLGCSENLLRAFQIALVLPIALSSALMLTIACVRKPLGTRGALAVGTCLFLLPLCGGAGWTQVVPLALWIAIEGWRAWRARTRAAAFVLCASVAAALAVSVAYAIGLRSEIDGRGHASGAQTLESAAAFLGMSVGPAGRETWPYPSLFVIVLCASTVVLVVHAARRRVDERWRAFGLLACFTGIVALALAIGFTRGLPGGEKWTPIRYVTLAAPALSWVYLAWSRYGSAAGSQFVRVLLFTVMAGLVLHNDEFGLVHARQRLEVARALERDVDAGLTIDELADKHWKSFDWSRDSFAQFLGDLRQAKFAPFDSARARATSDGPGTDVFASMAAKPIESRSDQPFRSARLGATPIALMHAPGEVSFEIPPEARRFRARYGIAPVPGAEAEAQRPDVAIRVQRVGARPYEECLLERRLEPARVPGDRAPQSFSIELPDGAGGILVLRARNAAGRYGPADWIFLGDVGFD